MSVEDIEKSGSGNISFSILYGATLLRVERQNRRGGDREEGLSVPLSGAMSIIGGYRQVGVVSRRLFFGNANARYFPML
jgi:hypothetical protein